MVDIKFEKNTYDDGTYDEVLKIDGQWMGTFTYTSEQDKDYVTAMLEAIHEETGETGHGLISEMIRQVKEENVMKDDINKDEFMFTDNGEKYIMSINANEAMNITKVKKYKDLKEMLTDIKNRQLKNFLKIQIEAAKKEKEFTLSTTA